MTELDTTIEPNGSSVDGVTVDLPESLRPTPAVMPPRRPDPDDIPTQAEIDRAHSRAEAERERRRIQAREGRERRARQPVTPPAPEVPVAEHMTAGRLAEFLQDVQASTPVWQVADSEDERDLVPVQFVEVLKVNGVVERLVIK